MVLHLFAKTVESQPADIAHFLFGQALRYSDVGNDPLNGSDPSGNDTHILVVIDHSEEPLTTILGGSHVAIYVDPRGSDPGVLFDPGGSFSPDAPAPRPAGAYYNELDGQNLFNAFVNYETRGKRSVLDITVPTTAEEEKDILRRTGGPDASDPGPMNCANSCGDSTRGVGPFKNRSAPLTPGGMKDRAMDAAKERGGQKRIFEGKHDKDGNPVADTTKRIKPRVECNDRCTGSWHLH